jgi:hypothetical protein
VRRLPVTRGDCIATERPCPHTTCRYAEPPVEGDIRRRSWSCSLDFSDWAELQGGLELSEIAFLLDMTIDEVRNTLVRARTKLYVRVHAELPPWLEAA